MLQFSNVSRYIFISLYKLWTVGVSERLSRLDSVLSGNRQLGFKKKRGTIEAIFVAVSLIKGHQKRMGEGKLGGRGQKNCQETW